MTMLDDTRYAPDRLLGSPIATPEIDRQGRP